MSGPCLSSSVADHPLRPATRLCLGEPLPRQLADGTRAHPSVIASMERPSFPTKCPSLTYPVLAILSDSCPEPKGRLPTCYAPVRRFTRSRSPVLARLACVKPAANVRSEPGSNSPVYIWSSSPPAKRLTFETFWFSSSLSSYEFVIV